MLEPIRNEEWNPSLAAHLLNRAGFGANPDTIARFAAMKPRDAVIRIVHYEPQDKEIEGPGWTTEPDADLRIDRPAILNLQGEELQRALQEIRERELERLVQLQHWWLRRMRSTSSPLEEKLTLFWHGHFATSFEKVRQSYALYTQNRMLRHHAAGNLRDLVIAVAQDPAMLYYLDNAISRRGAPNENFARELMELFTLGEGQYTETDIREAARAFTGWSIDSERIRFMERRSIHDGDRKTFMGLSGNLDGYDVINEILEHPACPPFIAAKLWRFFAYDEMEEGLAGELGRIYYEAGFELRPLLERIFMSREFYSWKAAYSQFKSPVQWLVGSMIALEGDMPDPATCSQIMRMLGQELFVPPSVKGWDGGASWITASSLMDRYNLAGYLVKPPAVMNTPMRPDSRAARRRAPVPMSPEPEPSTNAIEAGRPVADLRRVLPRKHRKTLDAAWDHLEWRMYQRRLETTDRFAVRAYLTRLPMPELWTDDDLRDLLHVMMSTPYYQVC